MKKIILSILSGALLFASCSSDFLNQFPDDQLTVPTFYKTKAHYEQATLASYTGLRNLAKHSFFIDEMRSDNALFDRYAGDRGPYVSTESIALFSNSSAYGSSVFDTYNGNYTNIQRINTALDRMGGSQLTDAEKTAYEAELKFLRAYYYFVLNRNYGGVPLMLKEVQTEADAFIARSTEAEVYDQILKDIDVAIAGLPNPTFPGNGRVTKGAALVVRAAVYLQRTPKDAVKAEADLKQLAALGYILLPNYADCFAIANKNNQESIFEVQYKDGTDNQHNSIPWRLIPKCTNNNVLMGIAGNNTTGESGGWVTPEEEFLNSYEAGDKRLDVTVGAVLGEAKSDDNALIQCRKVATYSNYKEEMLDGEIAKIFCRKYYHPPYNVEAGKAGNNIPLYRYGTALLMLAEALMEQGKSTEALPYVNQVRARAGLPALTAVSKADVLNEQRHENAYECHRWSELKRSGTAVPVMTAFGERMKAKYGWVLPSEFMNIEQKLVYPIHFRELDVNSKLEQNPGYN